MPETARSGDNLVEIERVRFSYGSRPVLEDVSLVFPRGQVTVVLGPSGCGKSTLLALIGGRLRPRAGDVRFDGRSLVGLDRAELYRMRRQMGMLFQSSALLTDLTVFDNVAFPVRENTDLPEPLLRLLVLMKLELVGLRGAQDLMPAELSGGMARRVALARAIALDPVMVLYDEPFTGLDPISMGVTVKLIRDLNDALGTTSVVVTHDVSEGCSIADYVYLMGNGTIIEHGPPQAMQRSDRPEVVQFMQGLPDGPVPYHYPASDYRRQLYGQDS
jgi:phospholipid/cholesterol/gamma-HCH transport system ATP-binding protein